MGGRLDDAGAHGQIHGAGVPFGSGAPTVLAASGQATVVDEGALHLRSIDEALPGLVDRAGHTHVPFTLVLARPGPSATPGRPAPAASPGDVEDLAASLSVSLSPVQDLYRAGAGYLAVVVPGRSGIGQREAMRLTRRAAGEGAPLFTWAAARFPRDAVTAAGLLEVAYSRLDGRLVSHCEPTGARTPERGTGRYGAAIWAAVGVAVLLGALTFALRGSTAKPPVALGDVPGQPGAANGAGGSTAGGQLASGTGGSSGGTSGSGGSGSSGSGSRPGSSGSAGSSSSGGAAGTSGGTGSGPSLGGPQAGQQQASGVTTTVPSSATTLPVSTSLPISTATTLPSVNSSTTTTTAAGTSSCTGLVQSLVCQTNNLLGSLAP